MSSVAALDTLLTLADVPPGTKGHDKPWSRNVAPFSRDGMDFRNAHNVEPLGYRCVSRFTSLKAGQTSGPMVYRGITLLIFKPPNELCLIVWPTLYYKQGVPGLQQTKHMTKV
jgi:hypothetical protein